MTSDSKLQYEIHVVLVRTLYGMNIGATCRAMTNMGAHQLHLIQPQCEIDYQTQQMAANGQTPLETRKVYEHWEDFFRANPEGIRVAMTARDGRARTVFDFKEGLLMMKELPDLKTKNETKLYLFLGPEDSGLSGEELDQCHFACALPTFGENWSLNLAQAALLSLFILRDTWGGQRTTLEGQFLPRKIGLHDPALAQGNRLPDAVIKAWIETLGFDLSKRRMNAYTVMRRILLHNIPNSKELRILEVVLQQTVRKLKLLKNQSSS